MSLDLNEFAKEVHKNAVEHGWWDKDKSFGEVAALIHSELSEALEEYRAGRPYVWYWCSNMPDKTFVCLEKECSKLSEKGKCKEGKPEGIAVELIDAVIRILDYFGKEKRKLSSPDIKHIGDIQFADLIKGLPVPHLIAALHMTISEAYEKRFNQRKKGMMDELENCMAGIYMWLTDMGIDVEQLLIEKHEYNKTRPYRHGGKVC